MHRLILTYLPPSPLAAAPPAYIELACKFNDDGDRLARTVAATPKALPFLWQYISKMLTTAAESLLGQLNSRFPADELLEALMIIYPQYWQQADQQKAKDDFITRLNHLITVYCHATTYTPDASSSPASVPALLSAERLKEQAPHFIEAAVEAAQALAKAAKERKAAQAARDRIEKENDAAVEAAEAAGKRAPQMPALPEVPPEPEASSATQFWRRIAPKGNPLVGARVLEFAKLAEIGLVLVTGSVEAERTFSSMNFIKTPRRNRLKEPHLNALVRLFSDRSFSLMGRGSTTAFPFNEVLALLRGGVVGGR